MKKDLIQTLKIITLGLILSAGCAFAWTAPSGAPTASNASTAINKGGNPLNPLDDQIKSGGLATGVMIVYDASNFHGNVSILADSTTSGGTQSGGSVGIIFNNIFSSFEKNNIKNNFNNILSTIFNTNKAYADFIGAGVHTISPTGCPPFCIGGGDTYPSFSFVYPSDPSDPYGNTYYPIAVYNSTNQSWYNTTASSTPSFKVTSPDGGTISFGGADKCATSTTSIPGGNITTTITLNHLYNDYYTCTLSLTNSSYTAPTALSMDFTVNAVNNSYPPPPPSSDLYVSGKVGIGSLTTPTEVLEVNGSVSVGSLENPSDPYEGNRICADSVGRMVVCPTGVVGYYKNQANFSNAGVSDTKFTVPNGTFVLQVVFVYTNQTHTVYVRPGQVIPIYFDTGSTPPSTSTTTFGTYFSSYGSNGLVVYY